MKPEDVVPGQRVFNEEGKVYIVQGWCWDSTTRVKRKPEGKTKGWAKRTRKITIFNVKNLYRVLETNKTK